MHRIYLFLFFIALISCNKNESENTSTFDADNFIFEDLDNFWVAHEMIDGSTDKDIIDKAFQDQYFDKASETLKSYWKSKGNDDFHRYTLNLQNLPLFFESIKISTLESKEYLSDFEDIYAELKVIYPDAKFPKVTFAIGFFQNGGRRFAEGLYIGLEMMSVDMDKVDLSEFEDDFWIVRDSLFGEPEELKHILAHELTHFQQDRSNRTVLDLAITEGGADFMAEILSGVSNNDRLIQKLDPMEEEVWNFFKEDLEVEEKERWFYNTSGSVEGKYPMDAGYYMGYKICQHYYNNASDKSEAIATILEMRDTKEFLALSGYEDKF